MTRANKTADGWSADEVAIIDGELSASRLRRDVAFVEVVSRGLDDALDAAYRDKYGRSSSALARITADIARATTPRLDPA